MNYDFVKKLILQQNKSIGLEDLTLVIGIRVQQYNKYILERLLFLTKYYNPLPQTVIIDFGSEQDYAVKISEICLENNLDYYYVDDKNVYSASIARNIGISHVKTPYVFFTDIDFFYTSDFFIRLLEVANSFDMANMYDCMLNIPVYHLNKTYTEEFFNRNSTDLQSDFLKRIAIKSQFSATKEVVDFIAPYSNNFMCHVSFFKLVGGYNERFRGHGSEDFEFLLRWCLISRQIPLPLNPSKDCYGPLKDEFYTSFKPYEGFRRLFEVLSFPVESSGLKMFHLYHNKPKNTSWVSANDWKREIFNEEVELIINNKKSIINKNWLHTSLKILVLLQHEDQFDYFLPLRLLGMNLELYDAKISKMQINKLKSNQYAAVAIFNPYMESHANLFPIFELAKAYNCPTIVIERGGVPHSIYYASDVAYNDSDYTDQFFLKHIPQNINNTISYINELKKGENTLEKSNDYTKTLNKYKQQKQICFIPLQLDNDMATNFFTDGYQSYLDFVNEVQSYNYEKFNEFVFIIKVHPLDKKNIDIKFSNVIMSDKDDNIHALLELANVVICYNSGVGLLALCHSCILKTVGNAYYNKNDGLGKRYSSFKNAMDSLEFQQDLPDSNLVVLLYDWLINSKYSFVNNDSILKEFSERFAHNYINSNIYQFNFQNFHLRSLLAKKELFLSKKSYISGKLNIFCEQYSPQITIDMCSDILGENWYYAEADGRWAGPKKESTLIIPGLKEGKYKFEADIVGEIVPRIIKSMTISINEKLITLKRINDFLPTMLEASFTVEKKQSYYSIIKFSFKETVSPSSVIKGSDDKRELAIRIKEIRIKRLK